MPSLQSLKCPLHVVSQNNPFKFKFPYTVLWLTQEDLVTDSEEEELQTIIGNYDQRWLTILLQNSREHGGEGPTPNSIEY